MDSGRISFLSETKLERPCRLHRRCIRNRWIDFRACACAVYNVYLHVYIYTYVYSVPRRNDISRSYPFKQNVKVPDDNAEKINQAC